MTNDLVDVLMNPRATIAGRGGEKVGIDTDMGV